jgi:hypothetical protein
MLKLELKHFFTKQEDLWKMSKMTDQEHENAQVLLIRINDFLDFAIDIDPTIEQEICDDPVNSGWRSEAYNKTLKGAAKNSAHFTFQAKDLRDPHGKLDRIVIANIPFMQRVGLYVEHPRYTKGWCHLSSRAPASGNIIYIPYAGKPIKEFEDSDFKNYKYV